MQTNHLFRCVNIARRNRSGRNVKIDKNALGVNSILVCSEKFNDTTFEVVHDRWISAVFLLTKKTSRDGTNRGARVKTPSLVLLIDPVCKLANYFDIQPMLVTTINVQHGKPGFRYR